MLADPFPSAPIGTANSTACVDRPARDDAHALAMSGDRHLVVSESAHSDEVARRRVRENGGCHAGLRCTCSRG